MENLGLFDHLEPTIQSQFLTFHARNPNVYRTLVALAREAVRLGHRKIGIGMLWERMRWELWVSTSTAEEWKLNNNFRSRYARLIMQCEPDLADVFELRELRAQ